jgi:hypothetical protein
VALSPRSGRLQGVAPPTSPCPAFALPPTRDQSRRQPYRIAAACSPPAVRSDLVRRRRGRSSGSIHRCRRRRFRRCRQHPEPSSCRLSAMGLWLRCAVRPSASGLPRPRARRASGPCRFAGCPVGFHRPPWSPRGDPVVGWVASSARLSPTVSCDPTSFDLGLRVGHRCPILAPFRWWPSAPTLFLQGPASIASCPRPP